MAKRPNQGIKNKTSRSHKTKKRLAAKRVTLVSRGSRTGSSKAGRARTRVTKNK